MVPSLPAWKTARLLLVCLHNHRAAPRSGREPPPRDHRQGRGVYSFREGETRPYDHVGEGLEHAGPVSPILFAPTDRPAARVREASRRLSLVMMAPWDTMGAYGDQITTSECTLYFVSDEAGCIVSNILGLEKKLIQCLWKRMALLWLTT